ncbi:hypothetical protein EIK77_001227 [Talaromyces pinophilus]|nr:hypothetical protein EIK77_001227 [Talaromyces pinophilus]
MAGISVHVTITIDPKDKDAFLTALKPTFDAVKAEPLNLFFEISYDEKNPGVFKLIESWNCTSEYIMSVSNTNSDSHVLQLQHMYGPIIFDLKCRPSSRRTTTSPTVLLWSPCSLSPSRSKSSTVWVVSGLVSTPPPTLSALKRSHLTSGSKS